MSYFFQALNVLFDLFYWGESIVSAYVFLLIASILSAVLFLYVFKKASNQEQIKRHKNKIWGSILQIRIYQDDFIVLVRSIGGIIWYNILYIKETLIPLVIIIVPLMLIMLQIDNHCGHSPFEPNESFQAAVTMEDESSLYALTLEPSEELAAEAGPVRVDSSLTAYWRVRVVSDGNASLSFYSGDDKIERAIVVSRRPRRFAPVKTVWSFGEGIANNAEGYLPSDTPVRSITASYPRAAYWFLFWDVDPIILYFIYTLIFALALKPVMKVNL